MISSANGVSSFGITSDSVTTLTNKTIAAADNTLTGVINNTLTTTTGDIIYASAANTPARLGIGSTDQVLKVSGGVPVWAAPAAGALTLIQRTSFSNVASQAFDSIFSTTYKAYLMVIENIGAAGYNDDLQLQFRYAGPTTQTADYYGNATRTNAIGTSSQVTSDNIAHYNISSDISDTTYKSFGQFFIYSVGNSSADRPYLTGSYVDAFNPAGYTNWGGNIFARLYTGVLLKSSSSNITGTVAFYGLATS